MINIKKAKLLHINPSNEEHVTLSVDGHIIECFVNSCPYAIEVGNSYSIELNMNLLDNHEAVRTHQNVVPFKKTGNGYAYLLFGTLTNNVFKTFTDLYDEDIHYEHPDLNNQFISLTVNRLDVNFL